MGPAPTCTVCAICTRIDVLPRNELQARGQTLSRLCWAQQAFVTVFWALLGPAAIGLYRDAVRGASGMDQALAGTRAVSVSRSGRTTMDGRADKIESYNSGNHGPPEPYHVLSNFLFTSSILAACTLINFR